MARIPDVRRQVAQVPGRAPQQRAVTERAVNLGPAPGGVAGNTGSALASIGQTLDGVGDQMARIVDQRQEREVQTAYADFARTQRERLDSRVQEMEGDPTGLSKRYQEEFDEQSQAFLGAVPNWLRGRVEARVLGLGSQLSQRADAEERRGQRDFGALRSAEMVDAYRQRVAADQQGATVNALLMELQAHYMGRAGFTAAENEAAFKEAKAQLLYDTAVNRYSADPKALASALKGDGSGLAFDDLVNIVWDIESSSAKPGRAVRGAEVTLKRKDGTSYKTRAYGAFQMLPGTAKTIAERHGLKYDFTLLSGSTQKAWDYQKKLSELYLADLVKRYENPILAGLAYHQGEGNLDRLLKRHGDPTQAGGPSWTEFQARIAKGSPNGADYLGKIFKRLPQKGMSHPDDDRLIGSLPVDLKKRAQREVDQQRRNLDREQRVAAKQFSEGFNDHIQFLANGGDPEKADAKFSSFESIVAGVGDAKTAREMVKRRAQAIEIGGVARSYAAMTRQQIMTDLRERAAALSEGDDDFEAKSRMFQAAQRAAKASLENRAQDPAGFALRADNATAGAAQRMALAQAENDAEGVRRAAGDYAAATLSAQAERGMPASAQRLLAKQDAGARAAAIAEMAITDQPQAVRGYLAAWPDKYRERVLGELVEAGLSPRMAFAARYDALDPIASQRILETTVADMAKIRGAMKDPDKAGILREVRAQMKEAREAFLAGGDPRAATEWTQLEQTAFDIALLDYNRNGDMAAAAKAVQEMLIDKHFEFAETGLVVAPVPKSSGLSADDVEDFAAEALSQEGRRAIVQKLLDAGLLKGDVPDIERERWSQTMMRELKSSRFTYLKEPGFEGVQLVDASGAPLGGVARFSFEEIRKGIGEPGFFHGLTGGLIGSRLPIEEPPK